MTDHRPTPRFRVVPRRLALATAIAALAASFAIVGCSKQEQAETREAAREAVSAADQKTRELGNQAERGMEKAKVETREAARDASQATQRAVESMGAKVEDAVITTTVKTELARDKEIHALHIDVDTHDGRVALKGTAPSEAARERAATLASKVAGVVGVDNQLVVDSKK